MTDVLLFYSSNVILNQEYKILLSRNSNHDITHDIVDSTFFNQSFYINP